MSSIGEKQLIFTGLLDVSLAKEIGLIVSYYKMIFFHWSYLVNMLLACSPSKQYFSVSIFCGVITLFTPVEKNMIINY